MRFRELGIADDRREHVVEVVCDATGEATDALHLLRLEELRLELFSIANVSRHRGHVLDVAVSPRVCHDRLEDGHLLAVALQKSRFSRPHSAAAGDREHLVEERCDDPCRLNILHTQVRNVFVV